MGIVWTFIHDGPGVVETPQFRLVGMQPLQTAGILDVT